MAASAAFSVEGSTPTTAVAVAASSTVDLALLSTSGVNSVAWSIVGSHSSGASNPTITPAGSPSGATASFPMPSGAGQAYLVQCVVNGGVDANGDTDAALTKRHIVGVVAASGLVPFAVGENLERQATHGWTEALNTGMGAAGTVPVGTADSVYTSNGTTNAWDTSPSLAGDITFTTAGHRFVTSATPAADTAAKAVGVLGGTGGVASATAGGAGGNGRCWGGTGGAGTASKAPGTGGNASILGGDGGAVNGVTAGGTGGDVTIQGGAGTGDGADGGCYMGHNFASLVSIGNASCRTTVNGVFSYGAIVPVHTIEGVTATSDATPVTGLSYSVNDATALVHIVAIVHCFKSSTGDVAVYKRSASFKAISSTVTQVGTTTPISDDEDAGIAAADVTIDNSGDSVRIRVTGIAGTDLDWFITAQLTHRIP